MTTAVPRGADICGGFSACQDGSERFTNVGPFNPDNGPMKQGLLLSHFIITEAEAHEGSGLSKVTHTEARIDLVVLTIAPYCLPCPGCFAP